MPISLRIPAEKEKIISKAAKQAGKSKTRFILDAVDEKLQLAENREQVIRKAAGWLSREEGSELRRVIEAFERVDEADWK